MAASSPTDGASPSGIHRGQKRAYLDVEDDDLDRQLDDSPATTGLPAPLSESPNSQQASVSCPVMPRQDARPPSAPYPVADSRDEALEVIDLTRDHSPVAASVAVRHASRAERPNPRLQTANLDVVNVPSDSPQALAASGSPEVQFVSERTVERPSSLWGDDVLFVGENRLAPMSSTADFPDWQGDLDLLMRHVGAMSNAPPPPAEGNGLAINFFPPAMNFETVGFDLGMERDESPPLLRPAYHEPGPAPSGFTRAPEEDDVLVCPNCRDELCTGDSDLKRQLWLIKSCGHVYCGYCAANRAVSRKKRDKTKASSKPFKMCVVEGCGKKTSHRTTMIQLFL